MLANVDNVTCPDELLQGGIVSLLVYMYGTTGHYRSPLVLIILLKFQKFDVCLQIQLADIVHLTNDYIIIIILYYYYKRPEISIDLS